jgi:hypothetical protein
MPGESEHRKIVQKSVKRAMRSRIFQVVENRRKINFRKCPKDRLRYDIMVL